MSDAEKNGRPNPADNADMDDFSIMQPKRMETPVITNKEPLNTDKNTIEEVPVRKRRRPDRNIIKKEKSEKVTKAKKIFKKILITAIVLVIAAAAAFAAFAASLPTDKIAHGIKVSGVNVGGLTTEDATEALINAGIANKHELILNADGKKYTLSPAEIETVVDIPATAEKAFKIAKDGNKLTNAVSALSILASGADITPVVSYNVELLRNKINEIGADVIGAALTEHTVRFAEDGKAYVVPGKSGYNNDPTEIIRMIDTALLTSASDVIDVKFIAASPAPLTIEALDAMMYANPVNASYVYENGNVTVAPGQKGRFIDKDACKLLIEGIAEGSAEVEIPYSQSEPEISGQMLKEKLFNAKLASYTTRFNAGQRNRSANVANAAGKLNGKILMPGETMSFNQVVGKRTIANGFKTAPEYQNGQTVDGIGGGTCQVSTTLYSAALYADLKIVKRSNHSMSVSYVPLGQDATVTDGGLDLQIMNDTEYPIKILSAINGGSVTFTIMGTAPEPAKTVKINHTSIPVSSGAAVKTVRVVTDAAGNVIKNETISTSRYKPHESASASNAETSAPTEAPTETAPEATEGAVAPEAQPEENATAQPEENAQTETQPSESKPEEKPEAPAPAPAEPKPVPSKIEPEESTSSAPVSDGVPEKAE